MFSVGSWRDPWMLQEDGLDFAFLWVDTDKNLRTKRSVEPTSDLDGVQLFLADGSVVAVGDFDMNGYSILNPLGIGGASGKAIRFCITEAEVITACEDADVRLVYILQKDAVPTPYTFSNILPAIHAIAPTSNTKIIGLGDVQLDWGGAAAGYMFLNNTGDNISFENIYWDKLGNNYNPVRVRHNFKMSRCRGIYTSGYVYIFGDNASFIDNNMSTGIYLYTGSNCSVSGGTCGIIRIGNYSQVNIDRIELIQYYIHIDNIDYGSSRIININNSKLVPASGGVACIYVPYISGTPADLSALKVTNCYLKPNNDTLPCVYVSDNASNNSSNIIFENNTFDVCSNVFEIANGTHTDWLLAHNKYLSYTGDIENISGTKVDWKYSMDNI